MTTDQTPPNDTGAPERIWAQPEHTDDPAYGGFWIKSKVAPSVEYVRADVAAAREAAAWIAGRDAAIAAYTENWETGSGHALHGQEAAEALAPQQGSRAALDRLIEERVREAVDRVSKLFEGCASTLVPADYAQGYREALEHVRDAARDSKEGQS